MMGSLVSSFGTTRRTVPPARSSRPARLAALCLLALMTLPLVACGPAKNYPYEPRARYVNPEIDRTQWSSIPRAEALALIANEPAPEVISRSERIIGNVLTQRTVFMNDTMLRGENYLKLTLAYDPYAWRANYHYDETVHRIEWSEQEILDQLEVEFPDLRAQIDSEILTNLYGLYSFANARAGREANCVYAWQAINDDERVLPVTIRAMAMEFRYCDPDMTTGQMLDIFSRVSLRFETGILPLIEPVSPTREVIDRAQKIDAEYRSTRFGPRPRRAPIVFDDDPRLNPLNPRR